ncbi:MAG: ATP-dependent DNA helicase RecG [Firmicutes bacterium]|nr:ATP-dependent DNA helicase RecG [Bacillota bacterium]
MTPSSPITALPSVGPSRAALFARLGVFTVGGLIEHYPRDYDDRSNVRKIAGLIPGARNTMRGAAAAAPELFRANGRAVVRLVIADDTGALEIVWFNQPYLCKQLVKNKEYIFTGKVIENNFARGGQGQARGRQCSYKMENPEFECLDGHELLSGGRIVPIYPSTAGLGQKLLRKFIKAALDALRDEYPENLPRGVLSEYGLRPKPEAVKNIHFPPSPESFYAARRRLVFEELFLTQTALFKLKGRLKKESRVVIGRLEAEKLLAALPYELTDSQGGALADIYADFRSGLVMNRLIQGDVGSGKTAVAMAAAYTVISNGYQAALMAPTEVLARQHFQTVSGIFGSLGIECVLLVGSLSAAEKKRARAAAGSGAARMIIGTHALIQEAAEYDNLGLVITDEQHRFGVDQRFSLSGKGEQAPHAAVMTATPIPRTLALILYGDLDISVMRGKPPGRAVIETYAVDGSYRPRIYAFLRKNFDEGRQAYIICPAIESEDAGGGNAAVKDYAERLRAELPGYVLAPLHGKMRPAEKQAVMDGFANGEIHVLVSTTVIEVGIDVPNATVMVIENADRFGLAQLHQLRGRVGRGKERSYCILISDAGTEAAKIKLGAMRRTSDGFELSELDLKTRGPGDFFGVAQHGLPEFKIADLARDLDILAQAQEAAGKALGTGEFDGEEAIDRLISGGRGKGKGMAL